MKGIALLTIFLSLLFFNPIFADYDEGLTAYNNGDYSTAMKEWKPLADLGNAEAQFGLGLMHYGGEGVIQDYSTALKLWRPLADLGNASAQYGLGLMYFNGEGVIQDHKTAIKWFQKAGEQGHAMAAHMSEMLVARQATIRDRKAQDNLGAILEKRAAELRRVNGQFQILPLILSIPISLLLLPILVMAFMCTLRQLVDNNDYVWNCLRITIAGLFLYILLVSVGEMDNLLHWFSSPGGHDRLERKSAVWGRIWLGLIIFFIPAVTATALMYFATSWIGGYIIAAIVWFFSVNDPEKRKRLQELYIKRENTFSDFVETASLLGCPLLIMVPGTFSILYFHYLMPAKLAILPSLILVIISVYFVGKLKL